ncbi:MAG: hypothetical protein ACM3X6_11955 [Patescibacteria group bacterium]
MGLGYLLVAVQAALFHHRQNFRAPAMWLPVIGGLLIGLFALLWTLADTAALALPVKILFWIGAAAGLAGFYYHFRGVGQRVGGYAYRNFLVGPPVILPLMLSALAAVGLFAAYWR